MLLLIQVVCLLTVATQTVLTAVIPNTVFWPTDPFQDALSDSLNKVPLLYQVPIQDEPEEVTTLGPIRTVLRGTNKQQDSVQFDDPQQQIIAEADVSPTTVNPFNSGELLLDSVQMNDVAALHFSALQQQNNAEFSVKQQNSPEVSGSQQQNSAEFSGTQQQNSAEVSGTQQQNSAEVSGTQQQNSAEVGAAPTTLNPFNSGEITPKPTRKHPSSGKIPESDLQAENNNEKGTASSAGTQAFNPHSSTGEPVKEIESASSAQPENTGTIVTAPGTQPFFPGITNTKEEQTEESNVANPINLADSVNSETANVERVQEVVGIEVVQPANIVDTVNTAPGTQPFFPGITNVNEEPQEDNNFADYQITNIGISSDTSKKTNDISVQEAEGGNSGQPNSGIETSVFTPESNSVTEEHQIDSIVPISGTINAEDISKIPGLEPFLPNEPGQISKIPGLEPILLEPSQSNSVPNSLRDTLAEVGISSVSDDPLVEQAKNYFISIWNLEANRFGAPYLEVTDVWPEIGMVYMPNINQMSSRIQNSKPVKEAAERLKSVWQERSPNKPNFLVSGSGSFGELFDAVSSWNIRDENTGEPLLYSDQNPAVSPSFPVKDFEADSLESLERINYEPLPLYRLYWN